MTQKIKIENEKYADALSNLKACVSITRQETVKNIERLLPTFKTGYGGNHVWVSTQDNERVAIIYF